MRNIKSRDYPKNGANVIGLWNTKQYLKAVLKGNAWKKLYYKYVEVISGGNSNWFPIEASLVSFLCYNVADLKTLPLLQLFLSVKTVSQKQVIESNLLLFAQGNLLFLIKYPISDWHLFDSDWSEQ